MPKTLARKNLKPTILIGTPIHISKDYAIERWLKSVSELAYPADLLIVDSSPGLEYVEKVKGYCARYGIANYKIEHLEINQEQGADERIGRSREIIRQEILSKDYDAWFSWECDQIIPPDTLHKLVRMINAGDYTIVHHNFNITKIPIEFVASFDCTLIKRECLEKFGFLLEYPNMPNVWHRGENWFKNQVVEAGGNYIEVYGTIGPKTTKSPKVLIGSSIHQVKDYCIERWLKNVSQLEYPADLLMVDNSPGLEFVEKVRGYCAKYGIDSYKLIHAEIAPELSGDRRVETAQEIIRQHLLAHDYDAWFSWECDQLIPNNALDKLISMMNMGNFWMVNHNSWVRGHPGHTNTDFGVSLIKRECLEKYSFLLQYGFDPDWPDVWEPGEVWIKKQVLKGGGNCLEAEGVIKPIYHLNENE